MAVHASLQLKNKVIVFRCVYIIVWYGAIIIESRIIGIQAEFYEKK